MFRHSRATDEIIITTVIIYDDPRHIGDWDLLIACDGPVLVFLRVLRVARLIHPAAGTNKTGYEWLANDGTPTVQCEP